MRRKTGPPPITASLASVLAARCTPWVCARYSEAALRRSILKVGMTVSSLEMTSNGRPLTSKGSHRQRMQKWKRSIEIDGISLLISFVEHRRAVPMVRVFDSVYHTIEFNLEIRLIHRCDELTDK